MASDDIPDASQLRLEGQFKEQVQHVLDNVRLTRSEVENLKYLFEDLEHTLHGFWPGCRVLPFGSIVTGLGIRTSDVDCFIDLPDHYKRSGDKYVKTAKFILQRQSWRFRELFAITTAKVPIVKFFHVPTQRYCDVSFKSFAGVRNSQLIAYFLHMDSRALPLAVLVKYWSKVHKLTGTNLIPNYMLTLMVIFYLQQVDVLLPVRELQRSGESFIVDNWDTSFNASYHHNTSNSRSLYDLIGGFFEFYSSFKFSENVISTYTGCSYSNKLFMKLDDVPDEFGLYKQNVLGSVCTPLRVDTPICVQDPFDLSRNTAVAVFPRLAGTFISYIQFASQKYHEGTPNDFLKAILTTKLAAAPVKRPVVNAHKNRLVKVNNANKVVKNTVNRRTKNNVYLNRLREIIKNGAR